MNGDHGQIVQQHAAKEFKQAQEHVRMMLKTSPSHSPSKNHAAWMQLTGSRGLIVQQHAIVASEQEQEHVLTILQATTMRPQLTKKLALFETVVVIGDHGEIVQ